MPGKMARSDARPSVWVTRALVAVSTSRLSCKRAGANANIDAGLGFIWRISVEILRGGAQACAQNPTQAETRFSHNHRKLYHRFIH